jgi:hypothetical protein
VSFAQLVRARASAMLSPALGKKVEVLLGNGAPLVAAPLLAAANKPARPWERGF